MFKLVLKIESKQGVLHFRRWLLFKFGKYTVYFHEFSQPDKDVYLHDHPWDFISFIIWGKYKELSCEKVSSDKYKITDRNFWNNKFKFVKAERFHKISSIQSNKVYSIFITGPEKRIWGYKVGSTWMDNVKYRELKNKNQ